MNLWLKLRWLRRWHIIKDRVSLFHKLFEMLTTKVAHTRVLKVVFDLKLERSNERSEIMSSPFSIEIHV